MPRKASLSRIEAQIRDLQAKADALKNADKPGMKQLKAVLKKYNLDLSDVQKALAGGKSAKRSKLAGKKVALFGSYGWGDGEWMRTWEDDCRSAGITLAADSVVCCEAPDDAGLEACKELGKTLAG